MVIKIRPPPITPDKYSYDSLNHWAQLLNFTMSDDTCLSANRFGIKIIIQQKRRNNPLLSELKQKP